MRCLVKACKHVNDILAVARQPPITTIEGLLKVVFPVGSAPALNNENFRPTQGTAVLANTSRNRA
jgi:hypothetical protein